MASRTLKVEIIGDASSLNKAFGSAAKAGENFGGKMKTAGKHMAIAGGIITGAAVVIGKKLVDAALAAETSQTRLDTAFKNAGLSAEKYAGQIKQAEDAGRQLGFTNIEITDSYGKLIQSGDSVKQATTDIALAQDYARATGRDLATATGSIVKVHQGLLRPLKELGISLPQITDHMKALTAEHKKSGEAITAEEKARAFQLDKLQTGAKAVGLMTDKLHGQAQAFSETSAGGMAQFNAQLESLQESLGTLLLPFLDKAVAALNKLLGVLQSLSPGTQKLIVDIGLGVAAFGALLLVVGPIVAAIGSLLPVIIALASPIGIVVVALVALTAALVAAVLWPDKLQQALQKMGLSAKTSKEIVDDLRDSFTAIKAVVQAVWPVIQAVIVPALRVIQGLLMIVSGILRGDFSEAWKGVKIVVVNELKFMLAVITAFPRVVLGVAIKIGAAILDGIEQGLRALPGKVKAGLAALAGILAGVAAQVPGWAAEIGRAIVTGIVNGMTGLVSAVAGKIIGGVKSAIGGAMGIFGHSPQEVIGVALVDGIIKGWNQKAAGISNAMVDKVNTAIDAAQAAIVARQGVFATAFDDLLSNALAAFDKVTEEFQTKTEKKITRQDEQRAKADRAKALADAKAAVTAAQTAIATPVSQNEGESPEDFFKRQLEAMNANNAALAAAQQQQADAEFAIQRAKDEKKAAQERKAYDDSRELQKRHFGEQLTALETQLEKGRISAAQFRAKVLALFEKFDVPFKNAGKALGGALAEGLHESFDLAAGAARDLVEAIARQVRKLEMVVDVSIRPSGNPAHRQHGGSVRKGSPYVVGEAGPELFIPSSSGRISPSLAGGGGMGGIAEIHTNVYIDSVQVTELVRREMLRFEKRNGRSAV